MLLGGDPDRGTGSAITQGRGVDIVGHHHLEHVDARLPAGRARRSRTSRARLAVVALLGAKTRLRGWQPNVGRISRSPYWVPRMIRIDSSTCGTAVDSASPVPLDPQREGQSAAQHLIRHGATAARSLACCATAGSSGGPVGGGVPSDRPATTSSSTGTLPTVSLDDSPADTRATFVQCFVDVFGSSGSRQSMDCRPDRPAGPPCRRTRSLLELPAETANPCAQVRVLSVVSAAGTIIDPPPRSCHVHSVVGQRDRRTAARRRERDLPGGLDRQVTGPR